MASAPPRRRIRRNSPSAAETGSANCTESVQSTASILPAGRPVSVRRPTLNSAWFGSRRWAVRRACSNATAEKSTPTRSASARRASSMP